MKSLMKFALASLLVMVSGASFASAQEMSMPMPMHETVLTNAEAKTLVVNAKTPEDHLKLAAFFREEARQEESKAKFHEEMSALYKTGNVGKFDMAAHCKQFAAEARKAAAIDYTLAEEHTKIADRLRMEK